MTQQIQPQIAQLELKFKGPLTKDAAVDTIADLLLFDTELNYLGKYVWVNDKSTFYYLFKGNGSELSDWEKLFARVTIERYVPEQTYFAGETVYYGTKIYNALQNVPEGKLPDDYPAYWLCITGTAETYRFLFDNTASVIVYTEIKNPQFEVLIGEFVLVDDQIVINSDTGLAELDNPEQIDFVCKQRKDLTPLNGYPYEISFFENSAPINLTGCINIK